MLRDSHHILITFHGVYGTVDLGGHHLQLLNSCRTVYVASHQQRFLVLLGLEHIGELTAERGLS